jgi:hypothetical protein
VRNVGGRETFTATPRRSRLVGAGPSMPKRSSSSHPGEPRHLLLRIYRSPTASGGQQHSTEYGVRSPGKAACSIPFLPCLCSNLHIFSGSVKAERQHFFTHGWPLDLVCTSYCLFRTLVPSSKSTEATRALTNSTSTLGPVSSVLGPASSKKQAAGPATSFTYATAGPLAGEQRMARRGAQAACGPGG